MNNNKIWTFLVAICNAIAVAICQFTQNPIQSKSQSLMYAETVLQPFDGTFGCLGVFDTEKLLLDQFCSNRHNHWSSLEKLIDNQYLNGRMTVKMITNYYQKKMEGICSNETQKNKHLNLERNLMSKYPKEMLDLNEWVTDKMSSLINFGKSGKVINLLLINCCIYIHFQDKIRNKIRDEQLRESYIDFISLYRIGGYDLSCSILGVNSMLCSTLNLTQHLAPSQVEKKSVEQIKSACLGLIEIFSMVNFDNLYKSLQLHSLFNEIDSTLKLKTLPNSLSSLSSDPTLQSVPLIKTSLNQIPSYFSQNNDSSQGSNESSYLGSLTSGVSNLGKVI